MRHRQQSAAAPSRQSPVPQSLPTQPHPVAPREHHAIGSQRTRRSTPASFLPQHHAFPGCDLTPLQLRREPAGERRQRRIARTNAAIASVRHNRSLFAKPAPIFNEARKRLPHQSTPPRAEHEPIAFTSTACSARRPARIVGPKGRAPAVLLRFWRPRSSHCLADRISSSFSTTKATFVRVQRQPQLLHTLPNVYYPGTVGLYPRSVACVRRLATLHISQHVRQRPIRRG